MARALKTYITSIGFYDLAVAAPSMKAALEAWGARQNLFHQGLAAETDDPDTFAATIEKPGVVLRRAVGTNRAYREEATPPDTLPAHPPTHASSAKKAKIKRKAKADDKAQKTAIISFEAARAKRDHARRQEETARVHQQAAGKRDDERRKRKATKASAALDRARKRHEDRLAALEKARQGAEDQLAAERRRWRTEETRLQRRVHDVEC